MFQFREKNDSVFDRKGFCAFGVVSPKNYQNVGVLWRSAAIYGASFLFTLGEKRYSQQAADTMHCHLNMPIFHFEEFEDLRKAIAQNTEVVGIEMNAKAKFLHDFVHPERAVYLLGSEDGGIPEHILDKCSRTVKLPGTVSLNLATCGSIVAYDRAVKRGEYAS